MVHAECTAPALLSEGEVHADRVNVNLWKLPRFFVESLGLGVANRGVKRRHDAENSYPFAGSRQVHRLQRVVDGLKIRGLVSGLQLRPDHGHGIASECSCSW